MVVNPFFPYLTDYLTAGTEDEIQKIMSHQVKLIKDPLLKAFPVKKYATLAVNNFNNLLKIGHDKNTTKSLH